MVKIVVALTIALYAWANMFDHKCENCHNRVNLPLKPIFFDYLLHYSSERLVKKAMKRQLLRPDPKKSLVKKKNVYKHKIDPNEIDILLQIYWNRYKVIGKIR
jgi:hypothetical protein